MTKRKTKDTALVASDKKGDPNWRQSAAIQKIYEQLDNIEVVTALLESGNDKAIHLAERLSDEKLDRLQLAKHCAKVGILPREVWNILIESRRLALKLHLSEAMLPVANTVIEQALPQIITCTQCKGKTTVLDKQSGQEIECPKCFGLGEIVRPGDKDSQKVALEMGEMINQKVPLVAQQFNTYKGGQDAGAPDLSEWTRSTDSAFEEHGKPRVQEAEIVES